MLLGHGPVYAHRSVHRLRHRNHHLRTECRAPHANKCLKSSLESVRLITMWENITHRGHTYSLGDEVRIVVVPNETYEGFLNVIEREYIVLVGTGAIVHGFE